MNMNASEPITGPGITWAINQINKHFDRVAVNGDCHAVVTVAEAGFKANDKIELTEAECQLVKDALEKKETV